MKGPKRNGWLVLVVLPLAAIVLPLVFERCSRDESSPRTTAVSHGSASPAIVASGSPVTIKY